MPASSANHGKHDQNEDCSNSSSSKAGCAAETVDQAEVIVTARVQVVKLANELKDLKEAAQDGYKLYLAAVTALKVVETIGYEELLARVKRARKGSEGDTDISRMCNADINHRHLANIDCTVAPINAALMKDADAANVPPPTSKKAKAMG
jgi:hypothetical protein